MITHGHPAAARTLRLPSILFVAVAAAGTGGYGCAREGVPPGGPPDRLPPIVISTEPDTFSLVDPFRSPVTIRFSERISERPATGTLDQAVVVSPASGEVRVSHGREGLSVRVPGGFEADRVYRLTVLPVIQDMFGNSLQAPFELFFSTGPEFVPNVLAGSVVDRLTGQRVASARVEAAAPGSDAVHTALSDTAGIFALRYLPDGEYVVTAYLDRNRNGEPDFSEPQGRRPAPLAGTAETTDTAIVLDVPLLALDSTSARLARVTVEDSISLRLSFDDFLDPESSLEAVRVAVTVDSVPGPAAAAILHEHDQEEYRRTLADSIAQAQADSAVGHGAETGEDAATADSAAVPGPEAAQPTAPLPAGGGQPGATEPERPRPVQTLIVILDQVLVPEVVHEIEISGITNINGIGGGGGTAAFTRPPPPPPDTTQLPADSIPPDTAAAPGDSLARDTTGVSPDSTAPDTTGTGTDTVPNAPDGTPVLQDTILPDSTELTTDSIPSDTVAVPGDTVARDTAQVAADSTAAEAAPDSTAPDTTEVPADSVAVRDTVGAAVDTLSADSAGPVTDSLPPETIPPQPGPPTR